MERLKAIKESLVNFVQPQMSHLDQVDSKELGDAVDMIKDMAEAIYYCTITKAMTDADEAKKHAPQQHYNYNPERMYYDYNPPYNYDVMRYENNGGRRYMPMSISEALYKQNQNNPSQQGSNGNPSSNYMYNGQSYDGNINMRDGREGRSPIMRRYYMDSKSSHKGASIQLQDLENYLKELSMDITEMIEGASQEEKTMLQQKLTTLANKIA